MPSGARKLDHLAVVVAERWVDLQSALSDKGKYPLQHFHGFVAATDSYIKSLGDRPLIHRSVVSAVNGLTEFLQAERKRTPGNVLRQAQRLECRLFSGFDPEFEGDEPPGL